MADDLTGVQNDRISALSARNGGLKLALKQERRARRAERQKLAAAEAKLAELQGAPPSADGEKVKALEAKLAERDHKDTFRAEAIKAGVAPAAVDDLYALSGLKVGDKPPQPGDFAEFLAGAKTARAWAFGAPDAGGTAGDAAAETAGGSQAIDLKPATAPGGGGRGESGGTSGRFTYRASDLADPAWMMANQGKLAEAVRNGTAHELLR